MNKMRHIASSSCTKKYYSLGHFQGSIFHKTWTSTTPSFKNIEMTKPFATSIPPSSAKHHTNILSKIMASAKTGSKISCFRDHQCSCCYCRTKSHQIFEVNNITCNSRPFSSTNISHEDQDGMEAKKKEDQMEEKKDRETMRNKGYEFRKKGSMDSSESPDEEISKPKGVYGIEFGMNEDDYAIEELQRDIEIAESQTNDLAENRDVLAERDVISELEERDEEEHALNASAEWQEWEIPDDEELIISEMDNAELVPGVTEIIPELEVDHYEDPHSLNSFIEDEEDEEKPQKKKKQRRGGKFDGEDEGDGKIRRIHDDSLSPSWSAYFQKVNSHTTLKFQKGMSTYYWDNEEFWSEYLAPEIDKEMLFELFQLPPYSSEQYYLIDLRPKEKYEHQRIPRTVNIPLFDISRGALRLGDDTFFQRYEAIKPKPEESIICISDDPHESEIAGFIFNLEGYPYTYNYRGGVQDFFGEHFKVIYVERAYPEQKVEALQKKKREEKRQRRLKGLPEEDDIEKEEDELEKDDEIEREERM